jgi:hypothetical protein
MGIIVEVIVLRETSLLFSVNIIISYSDVFIAVSARNSTFTTVDMPGANGCEVVVAETLLLSDPPTFSHLTFILWILLSLFVTIVSKEYTNPWATHPKSITAAAINIILVSLGCFNNVDRELISRYSYSTQKWSSDY